MTEPAAKTLLGIDLPPVDFAKVRRRIWEIIGTIQKHDEPGYLQSKFNVETTTNRGRPNRRGKSSRGRGSSCIGKDYYLTFFLRLCYNIFHYH